MANNYDHKTLSAIWAKATAVTGYDINALRKDICGAWCRFRYWISVLQNNGGAHPLVMDFLQKLYTFWLEYKLKRSCEAPSIRFSPQRKCPRLKFILHT